MVTIHLAGGDHLTITPNHPVLRGDGAWVPAHLLQEGDYCVRATPLGQFAGQPNEDRRPPEIGDVHHAASLTAMPQRIPLTPPDLHGDRPNGDVEVVPVYGDLAFNGQPASDQEVYQFGLALADKARTTSRAVNRGLGAVRSPGLTFKLDPGTSGRVSGGSQLTALLDRQVGHPEAVGLAGISDRKAQGGQAPLDDWAANVQISGHLQDTVPLFVTLAKIVKVERYTFHGHVFNLDTGAGWYIANGITIKNCRCTMLLVEPGEFTDMSNRQFLGGA